MENKCPDCGCENIGLDRETGEVTCRRCGLVIEVYAIDDGPEWRAFTEEEREIRSRVGMPPAFSMHDKGLATTIGADNRDASGRMIPPKTRFEMQRLRSRQTSHGYANVVKNLSQAMGELEKLSDMLAVPNFVKEQAAVIYRKALNKKLVRGRSITAVAAASLYTAIRATKTPRTLKEVAAVSGEKKKVVARYHRLLLRKIDIRMPLTSPLMHVSKIADKVSVSGEVLKTAVGLLHQAEEKHVSSGKDPRGFAAAALYVASEMVGGGKTQPELAAAADVTEVTVRNQKRNLCRELGITLPKRCRNES